MAWSWLNKLGYKYKDVYKNVFINEHKQLDMVKNCINFLKVMKNLKLYMIEFQEDETIKPKEYLHGSKVEGPNWHSVIIITHDECIFFTNDNIQQI